MSTEANLYSKTRKQIRALMPAGYKASIRRVSFMDLARGSAFALTITTPDGKTITRGGGYSSEFYASHRPAFDVLNSLKSCTLEGERLI